MFNNQEIKIYYDPAEVVSHLQNHTPITSRDLTGYLMERFECEQIAAEWMMLDLMGLNIIERRGWFHDKQLHSAYPLFLLTEEARNRPVFLAREVALTALPALSMVATEIARDFLREGLVSGFTPEQIASRLRSEKDSQAQFQKILAQILGGSSSNELRQFQRDFDTLTGPPNS